MLYKILYKEQKLELMKQPDSLNFIFNSIFNSLSFNNNLRIDIIPSHFQFFNSSVVKTKI